MYNRFQSDEIHGAILKVSFQNQEHTVITDEEGYFMLNLAPDTPIRPNEMWHEIEIELIEAPVLFKPGLKSVAEVLVPPADAEYGISDIDDTIYKQALPTCWPCREAYFYIMRVRGFLLRVFLNFVLIGDSGQEDPKIYREIVRKYPERILAIYIRDVQLADREKIAVDISAELQGHVEFVVVDNTVEAAEHAAKTGLIYT